MIRWTKGDYIKLGKAVANFNRQVAQNENQINKQYLPKLVDYKELRDRIAKKGFEMVKEHYSWHDKLMNYEIVNKGIFKKKEVYINLK